MPHRVAKTLRVFHIPCHDELFVGNARSVEARVYNVAGQQVAFDRASGDQLNLNLSHLASGVYVVNVNGNLSRRIIVK